MGYGVSSPGHAIGSFAAFRAERLSWHGGPAAFDAYHRPRFTPATWAALMAAM